MLEKQEHLYSTLFTSGQVLVERHGPPEVTEALTEALRLQWSYGFPYTPRRRLSRCLHMPLVSTRLGCKLLQPIIF
eukprot:g4040.t1